MNNAPCKDCKNRSIGCHTTCKQYLDFKEQHKREMKAFYDSNAIDCALRDLRLNRCERLKDKRGII